MKVSNIILLISVSCFNNGQSRPTFENTSSIVGGRPAHIMDYPFTVRLLIFTEESVTMCTGAGLSHLVIVTAAHCLINNPKFVRIQVGISSVYERLPYGIHWEYETSVYRIHAEYNYHTNHYDIALLGTNINSTGLHFHPVELPEERSLSPAPPLGVTIIGWGTTTGESGDYSHELRAVTIPVLDHNLCIYVGSINHVAITRQMFCAGDLEHDGRNSCFGDSGGPVINSIGILVGINSLSPTPCWNYHTPSVHTDIARLRHWIAIEAGV